jgi:glycosyltransferase involved in cell wall biosynthesis
LTSVRALDIVYVGTLPPHHGGTAVMCSQLLDGLARRGHTIRSIAPITASVAAHGDPFAELAAFSVHRYLVPRFETSPDYPADAAYRQAELEQVEELFEQAVSARRPDVVISGRETFARTVSVIASRRGVRWLQIVHSSTVAWILRGTYPSRKAAELLELLRAADCLATPARHIASALERLGVGPVEVIPNPVDLTRFRPLPRSEKLRSRLQIDAAAVVVAHVSNLKAMKRVEDLVRAADLLRDADLALVYVVLGNGPERRKLRELVAARGLESRFRFVDWVEHELVPDYLNLADIVVMPSSDEAQALVYLETQACGRALVASDIPAVREVVEDGKTGVLHALGDVIGLSAAIERLARSPKLRAEIGRHAVRRAEQNTLESTVSGYETQLAELRARASAPRAAVQGLPTGDVTAVLLTMGESSTDQAYASILMQTLQPTEIIRVERVAPFFAALERGVSRVRTPFLVQVDADMVLDETCIERLRDAITREMGIATGQLRDPLAGTIAGVKLFRRECFDEVPLRDSVMPDIDFYVEIGGRGWLTLNVLSYDRHPDGALHTFGDHLPDYTPAYTYATYALLGCRYFRRRDLVGLLWRYEALRRSGHSMALVARVALLTGLFRDEDRDVPKSSIVADRSLLDGLASSIPEPQALPESSSAKDWYVLGRRLRRRDRFRELHGVLRALDAVPPSEAWRREAALLYGFCGAQR